MTDANAHDIICTLEEHQLVFRGLFENVSGELIHWCPEKGKWSLLEILCHLIDEEKEDFRARVQITLEQPETYPPPIDPEGWVKSRNYAQRNYGEMLQQFLEERLQSVLWLKSLEDPRWENGYEHRHFGRMTAGLFLSNWLAHDYLHIRQIICQKHQYLGFSTREDLRYAGEW